MDVLKIFWITAGILGDFFVIKGSVSMIRFILKLPEPLPKRAHILMLIGLIVAFAGWSWVSFYQFSWAWLVCTGILSFGLVGWGRIDYFVLKQIERLRHEGRLAEVKWFHMMLYKRYLRNVALL